MRKIIVEEGNVGKFEWAFSEFMERALTVVRPSVAERLGPERVRELEEQAIEALRAQVSVFLEILVAGVYLTQVKGNCDLILEVAKALAALQEKRNQLMAE